MRWAALVVALVLVSLCLAVPAASAADPTITIAGTVTDNRGNPFPGVTITFRNATGSTNTVSTDASGQYSFTTAAGTYSVTATYSGYRANTTYTGIDRTSGSVNFFMYEVLATVTGQVTDGNSTLDGVLVTLTGKTSTGANVSFSAYTSKPLGDYHIENVTPGWYMIYAFKEGYNITYHKMVLELNKGSVEEVSFTLTETVVQYAKLSGRVTYNGEPLSGVKVVLTPQEGADLATVTDASGNYMFDKVAPGEYMVYLTKDGFATSEKRITVEPLKGLVADFSMKRNALPGNAGFVLDYDLSHSMMIVGLGLSLLVTLASLVIRQRIKANPDLLAREKEDETAPTKE